MKTGLDAVIDVWSLINVQSVTGQITGRIYQFEGPGDERMNYVLNCQGLNNDAYQYGLININAHAPNLMSDKRMPDMTVLKKMVDLVTPLVETQFKETFSTALFEQPKIFKDTDGTFFANIKVEYRSFQSNYKNI